MIKNKYIYEEYVKASRLVIPSPGYPSIYNEIIDSLLRSQAQELLCDFDVIECFTLNKYPCINLANENSHVLLIYDRYMEHINMIFNFLYDNKNDSDMPAIIDKAIYGLCAEEALLKHNKTSFIYSALNYNARDIEITDFETSLLEQIQIYFLILHEYGHFLYGHLDKLENLEFVQGLLELVQGILEEIINNLSKEMQIGIDDGISGFIHSFKNDETLIEECFCDVEAVTFIFTYLAKTLDTEVKKLIAVKAIFYQLFTLKLLVSIKDSQTEEDVKKLELRTFIRTAVVKSMVDLYCSETMGYELEKLYQELHAIDKGFCNVFLERLYDIQYENECIKNNKSLQKLQYDKYIDLYKGLFL